MRWGVGLLALTLGCASTIEQETKYLRDSSTLVQEYVLDAQSNTRTDLPDAIAIFPKVDQVGVFYNAPVRAFLDSVREHYDLRILITDNDQGRQAIRASDELIILAGHGDDYALSWGLPDPATHDYHPEKYPSLEKYLLDQTDSEWKNALQKTSRNARILVLSCSAGKGGRGVEHLASSLEEWAAPRSVIAATMPVFIHNLKVTSWYPFEAKYVFCSFIAVDCTY